MVAALALGSLAAVMWAAAAFMAAPASRIAGPWTTTFWVSSVAALAATLLALTTGPPAGTASDWALVAVAGTAYTVGSASLMRALYSGHVGVVVPITATDGAMAAVLAILAGSTVSVATAATLGVVVAAVVVVSSTGPVAAAATGSQARVDAPPGPGSPATAIAAAVTAAVGFGVVFFAAGQLDALHPLWLVALSRAVPSLFALVVVTRAGGLAPPRAAWRWLVACGVLDAGGYCAYVLGAEHDLVVAAVATTQNAALAALAGAVFLGERLSKRQIAGVALLVGSATALAAQGL